MGPRSSRSLSCLVALEQQSVALQQRLVSTASQAGAVEAKLWNTTEQASIELHTTLQRASHTGK